MKTVDLVASYPVRNIEGVDKDDILGASIGTRDDFRAHSRNTVLHVPSGTVIYLECAQKYFEPKQSYFRLNKNSKCSFVRDAMDISCSPGECLQCIAACIAVGRKIKPIKYSVNVV